MATPRRPLIPRLVLAAAVTAVALVAGYFALELAGVDVERRLWRVRERVLGPAPIGIWQEDAVLGWVHRPNARGYHLLPGVFEVSYSIDEEGHRVTSGDPRRPRLLFLGGSFTFGHGVEDGEPYPALLQARWSQYKVVNAAVNAWGTAHAVLELERELLAHDDIRLVVYGFIHVHPTRNYLRRSWLEAIMRNKGRRNPYFVLGPSGLAYEGLADPERDSVPDHAPELIRMENRMTRRLLLRMRRATEERGIPLRVLLLPDGSTHRYGWMEGALLPRQLVDLRGIAPYDTLRLGNDLHLSPHGHRQVAAALEPVLTELVGPPAH